MVSTSPRRPLSTISKVSLLYEGEEEDSQCQGCVVGQRSEFQQFVTPLKLRKHTQAKKKKKNARQLPNKRRTETGEQIQKSKTRTGGRHAFNPSTQSQN